MMNRSKFTEDRIIGVLREQEAGATTAEVCRGHGISTTTCLSMEGEARRHGSLEREAAACA